MVNFRKATITSILAISSIVMSAFIVGGIRHVAAAPPPSPTGVDGVIGPEWAGVTPTFVPYDPTCSPSSDACGGQLVAFNVYTRADANYLYVAVEAKPAPGDKWNDAIILGNNNLTNIYLKTNPGAAGGSTLLILPGGDDCTGLPGYENPNSVPNPTCNETHFGPAGTSVFYVASLGTPGGPNDSPPGTGGVAEMAISWTVLQHDPDYLGFPLVKCDVNVRIIQAFGNYFSGAQFGPNRFGTFSSQDCQCGESDGNGNFQGQNGQNGNFQMDNDGCKDGDNNNVQSANRGDGQDFKSTQINSAKFNPIAGTLTITGIGITHGVPVTFVFVALETGPTTPGWVSFAFSDGYTNAGTLINGNVLLH